MLAIINYSKEESTSLCNCSLASVIVLLLKIICMPCLSPGIMTITEPMLPLQLLHRSNLTHTHTQEQKGRVVGFQISLSVAHGERHRIE